MHWAAPDSDHAVEKMRWVRENWHIARERAGKACRQIAEKFSLEAVGLLAYERLLQLLQRTDPAKSRRLDRQSRVGPPVPIPGEWFDADYFDYGLKSNWAKGYHWRDFAGLFRQTADFLVSMFPETESFLDAGCAKGFLVRALRERGKEAWGFDHSHWALERAEELARPFLHQVSAESAVFDRTFDVTLAFSLLENLTEQQASEFLQRARLWTRQAIVAVVLTCEDDNERARLLADDRDLAHLTLQSRAWWHDRFLHAGWRQDALHRVSERACQAHPLPTRMGWKIFAYAP
jgi:SAM-dependent methyltransferase